MDPLPPDVLRGVADAAHPPGSHLGLRWRTPAGGDLTGLVDLVGRVTLADRATRVRSAREIDQLASGEAGAALLGVDSTGAPRAFAGVALRGRHLESAGLVDPAWRGSGTGRALLTWQVEVARALAERAHLGPTQLVAVVDDADVPRRRLHAAAGFTSDRSILLMCRDLDDGPVPPESGAAREDGVRVLALGSRSGWDDGLLAAARAARPDLVGTDDASLPAAVGSALTASAREVALARLSLVAFDAAGEVVGLLVTGEPAPAPHLAHGLAPTERSAAWTEAESILAAPSRGPVAVALLEEGLRRLAEEGVGTSLVAVDAASPLRACLHSVGYGVRGTQTRWTVDV